MTRTERISRMELLFDESKEVIDRFGRALEDFAEIQTKIAELDAYYTSPHWRADFEADEAGRLPANLKRGVLSEDGLYELLDENNRLLEQLQGRMCTSSSEMNMNTELP